MGLVATTWQNPAPAVHCHESVYFFFFFYFSFFFLFFFLFYLLQSLRTIVGSQACLLEEFDAGSR
jgi:hypothetical protein